MPAGVALRRTGTSAGAFDPRTAISWELGVWADDPSWTNPGNGNTVTSWRNFGTRAGAGDLTNTGSPKFTTGALNGQSIVDANGGYLSSSTFSSALSQTYSIVHVSKSADSNHFYDNVSGSNRATFYAAGPANIFAMFAGSTSTTKWTNVASYTLHTEVYKVPAAKYVNGTSQVGSWNCGTNTLDSVRLFQNNSASVATPNVQMAFFGVYAGDITADGQWAAFKSWVASTYGLTIA